MKKLALFPILFPLFALAQTGLPSYPAILKDFFSHYSYTPKEPVDGLNFARMKDGWHVQVIDRVTEKVKSDQIYWTVSDSRFSSLYGFDAAGAEQEANIRSFLLGNHLYLWYGYERCRYYGYSHWAEDMINDFGGRGVANYSDTLIEGLGRAYSAYASKFLWYQYGGQNESNDPFKRKLGPLEMPSRQRVDSVAYYISKSIETYRALDKKNGAYAMLVGNPAMKVFNEQMNAYMHLSMAGYDEMAGSFLASVTSNKVLSDVARNYLDACAPNAILFTYGDNDTYPLWYIQEKEGYRKDVAVINTSLMGVPAYVELLKRKKIAAFSTTRVFYGDSSFLYFLKDKKEGAQKISLGAFIGLMQSRRTSIPSETYGRIITYAWDTLEMKIDLKLFQKIWNRPNLTSSVKIDPGYYLLNEQFMVLDIVNTNVYNRPVYFAGSYDLFKKYLLQSGTVLQFMPLDAGKEELSKAVSARQTGAYLARYRVIPSELSNADMTVSAKDEEVLSLYSLVARQYLESGRRDSAAAVLKRLVGLYGGKLPVMLYEHDIPELLIAVGNTKAGLLLLGQCAKLYYNLYKEPSAMYSYVPRENVLEFLNYAQGVFVQNGAEDTDLSDAIESLGR